ncbi:MAG: hypothetical protein ACP5HU_13055 [Phycisphaerae bacterium]
MARTLSLKRFTNVAILKRINTTLLLEFLEPHRDFLVTQRGLPWPEKPEDFDHRTLANILMSPGVDTPEELLDALYFVDNLADPDCYERILREAEEAGINVSIAEGEDPTPEDLTLCVWLADQRILERVHAEMYRSKPKAFLSFFSMREDRPDLDIPDETVIAALEDDLNDWFDWKRKGRGARLFPFPKEDGFWFLVRHGQRIKREGTVEADGESGSVFYRPEKFDVLIYYPDKGELAVYTETKGEQQIYCTLLGKHLFKDIKFFRFKSPIAKYTLQPLIEQGRSALVCSDIDGIESIELYALDYCRDSDFDNRRTVGGDDVFGDIGAHGPDLSEPALKLLKAKFRVTFTGGRQRIISIEPPNRAVFDRETDSPLIHDWMAKRGFISPATEGGTADATRGAVMAMA